MQVILLKELQGRGGEGDVINVARGFANNYLLRQGIAVKATKGNLKQLEQRRANIEKRENERVNNANELAEKLNSIKVHVEAQVGEEGILFGSVTAAMIANAIKEEHDVEVDRRRIELQSTFIAQSAELLLFSLAAKALLLRQRLRLKKKLLRLKRLSKRQLQLK